MKNIYKQLEKEIISDIINAVKNREALMTSDTTTDNHNKIKYLTLTLNYLINWTLRTRTLFTSKFLFAKNSGRNILFEVQEQLQVFRKE